MCVIGGVTDKWAPAILSINLDTKMRIDIVRLNGVAIRCLIQVISKERENSTTRIHQLSFTQSMQLYQQQFCR